MASLTGSLPALVQAHDALVRYLAGLGVTTGIADFGGFRTQADTAKILTYRQNDYTADVAAGRVSADTTLQQYRPIAPYGSSFHDFGAAFDLDVIAKPSGMSDAQALALAGDYAPSIGLRWGGTFANPDPDHFELAESLAQAAQDYNAYVAAGGGSSAGSVAFPVLAALSVGGLVAWLVWRRFVS